MDNQILNQQELRKEIFARANGKNSGENWKLKRSDYKLRNNYENTNNQGVVGRCRSYLARNFNRFLWGNDCGENYIKNYDTGNSNSRGTKSD